MLRARIRNIQSGILRPPPLLSFRIPLSFLRSGTIAVAVTFVLSPFFFACTLAPTILPVPARISVPATAAAAPNPSAIRLEYQGCLHRATGLHHCLRRSTNHQQPTSATLALSLYPSASSSFIFFLLSLFLSPSGGKLHQEYEYHTLPPDSPFRLPTYSRV